MKLNTTGLPGDVVDAMAHQARQTGGAVGEVVSDYFKLARLASALIDRLIDAGVDPSETVAAHPLAMIEFDVQSALSSARRRQHEARLP